VQVEEKLLEDQKNVEESRLENQKNKEELLSKVYYIVDYNQLYSRPLTIIL